MITISVIIPTYNEEAKIETCLKSLSRQTLNREEYEIIVVDGNSKDRTRELAKKYADKVIIQTSKKVGGARNDGILRAKGAIVATTDADCIIPNDWLEIIKDSFKNHEIVQLYGPLSPMDEGIMNRIHLAFVNILSRTMCQTPGCNTAFDKQAFIKAGMYRCIDAGDDIEIAARMKKLGRVKFDGKMKVGFSMRRYQQFGRFRSIYEWLYIASRGGISQKYSYSRREYKPASGPAVG